MDWNVVLESLGIVLGVALAAFVRSLATPVGAPEPDSVGEA